MYNGLNNLNDDLNELLGDFDVFFHDSLTLTRGTKPETTDNISINIYIDIEFANVRNDSLKNDSRDNDDDDIDERKNPSKLKRRVVTLLMVMLTVMVIITRWKWCCLRYCCYK